MKEKQIRKKFNFIFVFFCIIIAIWLIKDNEQKIIQKQNNKTNSVIAHKKLQENIIIEKKQKEYPKTEIIENYNGYTVSALLQIPKINLETYVLKNYSETALRISVTKFWGGNPNEVGNFCIAGHNFQNKNMFRNLKELVIGDKIYLSDNSIGKIEYEIYDLYKVIPEDVGCLSQLTNGKREITLITCTNDSKKRIIVKAKEVL